MIDLSKEIILSLILRSFVMGVLLGVLYESVRIVKMLLGMSAETRAGKILLYLYLFFTDLSFCLLFAFSVILLTYNISGGVFRGCVYFCMACGLIIYRLTLGRLMSRVECWITEIIRKSVRAILGFVLIPIRAIFSLVYRFYSLTIGRIIGKIIYKARQKRKEKTRGPRVNGIGLLPQTAEKTEEEENNAKRARGYKKEGRISFGAGR